MAIRSSEYFTWNGRSSKVFNIVNINISSGLMDEPFLANRNIIEERVRGNPVSYFIDTEYKPLEFTVSFYFYDGWDSDKLREVARWIHVNSPKELSFSDDGNRVYYGMFQGNANLIHNGLRQGYITLNFRSISPYAYTPVYTSPIFDYSSNDPANGTDYTFDNVGDLPCKPIAEIEIVSGDSFFITNTSTSESFAMTGLEIDEQLTIDFEAKDIVTDIPMTYRYDNVSEGSSWLSMLEGNNYLNIKGNIKIQWKWQAPLLQG